MNALAPCFPVIELQATKKVSGHLNGDILSSPCLRIQPPRSRSSESEAGVFTGMILVSPYVESATTEFAPMNSS